MKNLIGKDNAKSLSQTLVKKSDLTGKLPSSSTEGINTLYPPQTRSGLTLPPKIPSQDFASNFLTQQGGIVRAHHLVNQEPAQCAAQWQDFDESLRAQNVTPRSEWTCDPELAPTLQSYLIPHKRRKFLQDATHSEAIDDTSVRTPSVSCRHGYGRPFANLNTKLISSYSSPESAPSDWYDGSDESTNNEDTHSSIQGLLLTSTKNNSPFEERAADPHSRPNEASDQPQTQSPATLHTAVTTSTSAGDLPLGPLVVKRLVSDTLEINSQGEDLLPNKSTLTQCQTLNVPVIASSSGGEDWFDVAESCYGEGDGGNLARSVSESGCSNVDIYVTPTKRQSHAALASLSPTTGDQPREPDANMSTQSTQYTPTQHSSMHSSPNTQSKLSTQAHKEPLLNLHNNTSALSPLMQLVILTSCTDEREATINHITSLQSLPVLPPVPEILQTRFDILIEKFRVDSSFRNSTLSYLIGIDRDSMRSEEEFDDSLPGFNRLDLTDLTLEDLQDKFRLLESRFVSAERRRRSELSQKNYYKRIATKLPGLIVGKTVVRGPIDGDLMCLHIDASGSVCCTIDHEYAVAEGIRGKITGKARPFCGGCGTKDSRYPLVFEENFLEHRDRTLIPYEGEEGLRAALEQGRLAEFLNCILASAPNTKVLPGIICPEPTATPGRAVAPPKRQRVEDADASASGPHGTDTQASSLMAEMSKRTTVFAADGLNNQGAYKSPYPRIAPRPASRGYLRPIASATSASASRTAPRHISKESTFQYGQPGFHSKVASSPSNPVTSSCIHGIDTIAYSTRFTQTPLIQSSSFGVSEQSIACPGTHQDGSHQFDLDAPSAFDPDDTLTQPDLGFLDQSFSWADHLGAEFTQADLNMCIQDPVVPEINPLFPEQDKTCEARTSEDTATGGVTDYDSLLADDGTTHNSAMRDDDQDSLFADDGTLETATAEDDDEKRGVSMAENDVVKEIEDYFLGMDQGEANIGQERGE